MWDEAAPFTRVDTATGCAVGLRAAAMAPASPSRPSPSRGSTSPSPSKTATSRRPPLPPSRGSSPRSLNPSPGGSPTPQSSVQSLEASLRSIGPDLDHALGPHISSLEHAIDAMITMHKNNASQRPALGAVHPRLNPPAGAGSAGGMARPVAKVVAGAPSDKAPAAAPPAAAASSVPPACWSSHPRAEGAGGAGSLGGAYKPEQPVLGTAVAFAAATATDAAACRYAAASGAAATPTSPAACAATTATAVTTAPAAATPVAAVAAPASALPAPAAAPTAPAAPAPAVPAPDAATAAAVATPAVAAIASPTPTAAATAADLCASLNELSDVMGRVLHVPHMPTARAATTRQTIQPSPAPPSTATHGRVGLAPPVSSSSEARAGGASHPQGGLLASAYLSYACQQRAGSAGSTHPKGDHPQGGGQQGGGQQGGAGSVSWTGSQPAGCRYTDWEGAWTSEGWTGEAPPLDVLRQRWAALRDDPQLLPPSFPTSPQSPQVPSGGAGLSKPTDARLADARPADARPADAVTEASLVSRRPRFSDEFRHTVASRGAAFGGLRAPPFKREPALSSKQEPALSSRLSKPPPPTTPAASTTAASGPPAASAAPSSSASSSASSAASAAHLSWHFGDGHRATGMALLVSDDEARTRLKEDVQVRDGWGLLGAAGGFQGLLALSRTPPPSPRRRLSPPADCVSAADCVSTAGCTGLVPLPRRF